MSQTLADFLGHGHLLVEKVLLGRYEDFLAIAFGRVPTQRSSERQSTFSFGAEPREPVTTSSGMTDPYLVSLERPRLSLTANEEREAFDSLQEPITTFTALLSAAQSVEVDATASVCDAAPAPASSVTKRRLRNRESCRKTRLKRKLQQHALDVLVRERQERHQYLQRLSHQLDGRVDNDSRQSSQSEIFRDFVARSVHYALVDSEYSGWPRHDSNQIISCVPVKKKRESEVAAHTAKRKSKRLRVARDSEISSAPQNDSESPQASLLQQWRPLVDGLQNVDLKIYRTEETNLEAGIFERHCDWRLVGVSSIKIQRNGEIAAVAVTGTTHLRFHGYQVNEVSVSDVRRQDDVPFDFDARRGSQDGHDSNSSLEY